MNIVHVISSIDPRKGGPTTAVAGMAESQAAAGLHVTLAATYSAGADCSTAEHLQEHGAATELIGPTRPPLGHHPELDSTLTRIIAQADILHIHALWEAIQYRAAIIAQQHNVPYIISPHGMLSSWALHRTTLGKRIKKQLYLMLRMRRVIERAAAIHYITEFERELSKSFDRPSTIIVEPVGIDMDEFETLPEAGSFRKRHEIGKRPLLVFLGRIYPGKGLEYLIPALAEVNCDDCALAIVGPDVDGHQRHIESVVREHRLQSRIHFTGMLHGTEKVAALVDADLFCLPSDHENFGVVVIEALAAGTPVVISDQVSMHREITAAGVGSVVARSPSEIARAINDWLFDEAKRTQVAEQCRSFVQQHYDWSRIARHWSEHYAQFISNDHRIQASAGAHGPSA